MCCTRSDIVDMAGLFECTFSGCLSPDASFRATVLVCSAHNHVFQVDFQYHPPGSLMKSCSFREPYRLFMYRTRKEILLSRQRLRLNIIAMILDAQGKLIAH